MHNFGGGGECGVEAFGFGRQNGPRRGAAIGYRRHCGVWVNSMRLAGFGRVATYFDVL